MPRRFPCLLPQSDEPDLASLSHSALEAALVVAKAVVRARQTALREAVFWMERVFTEIDRRNPKVSPPSKRA
jgi:hypothetical protein